MGKHVKVPEGRGQLGVSAPFVLLLHGKCHVDEAEGLGLGAGGAGKKSRLGSMRLLGSGVKLNEVMSGSLATSALPQPIAAKPPSPTTGLWSNRAEAASPPVVPDASSGGMGGKWVGGPNIIYCLDEVAYHFTRDSLVFVPSERSLPWLPASYVFAPPSANSAEANGHGGPYGGMAGVPEAIGGASVDPLANAVAHDGDLLGNPLAA